MNPLTSSTRRRMLNIAFWGSLFAAILPVAAPALAAEATSLSAQAPGFYRLKLGDFQVTVLLDGTRTISAKAAMRNIGESEVRALVARGAEPDEVMTSFNAFLIDTGNKRVLVDTGGGSMFGAGLGHMLVNLQAAGYRPEQIDEVLLTHLHVDHVGGLVTADGRRVFINANIRVSRIETDYWLSADKRNNALQPMQVFFKGAQEALKPYADAKQLEIFDGDAELLPGIQAMALPGHSHGHTGYLVSSQGRQLMLWGDLVHMGVVQFARPITGFRADSDPAGAAEVRQRSFEQAARTGALIGGAHIAFPGLGHVRADGPGFRWLPLAYDTVP
ncbi:MBL fold metallo-hydrolase [Variovorax sp. J22P271]|uniref:MBL fold metallo-hydrolase n=1 Tax=Variovorax davisae TaxID=3053515 RepID=UPI002578BFD2|nr:MBL fold metallo-hydrolase [Variovorax sp. J22P271]MDM0032013.1 MBL fold metallo-hydrolase [Variovorax sp. J22P271]